MERLNHWFARVSYCRRGRNEDADTDDYAALIAPTIFIYIDIAWFGDADDYAALIAPTIFIYIDIVWWGDTDEVAVLIVPTN